jgi:prepilin-type N-terminal cleavage/methylation domain-containing protein
MRGSRQIGRPIAAGQARASGCHARRGFTLAEVLLACVILSFAVLSITQMIVAGQMQTYEALHHRRGQSLAEALMDEVLSLPYHDPVGALTFGPEPGQDRMDFDHMDDFHSFTEELGEVRDAAGDLYGQGFARFGREVQIVSVSKTIANLADDLDGLEVTVAVTDDRGMTWTITRFVPEPPS